MNTLLLTAPTQDQALLPEPLLRELPPVTVPLIDLTDEETRDYLDKLLREFHLTDLPPGDPDLWDMHAFVDYLEALGPEAPAGITGMPQKCMLYNWRAGYVGEVWGRSYIDAATGRRHTLPIRAQAFVAWMDMAYPHTHVQVKNVLPIARMCAEMPETALENHVRFLMLAQG